MKTGFAWQLQNAAGQDEMAPSYVDDRCLTGHRELTGVAPPTVVDARTSVRWSLATACFHQPVGDNPESNTACSEEPRTCWSHCWRSVPFK